MKTGFTFLEETKKEEKFIDREEERESFWKSYDVLCEREEQWTVTVFHFWGMGGIGKSALLKKLLSEAAERNEGSTEKISTAYVSLGEKDNDTRIMNRIAVLLKRSSGFSFPLYELGIFVLAVNSGNSELKREIETLEEKSTFLGFLLDGAQFEPHLSFAARVFRLLDKCAKEVREYINDHKKWVEEFEKMMPDELTEKLPELFIRDMVWNSSKVLYPILIFLDKLEVLRTGISGIDEIDFRLSWLKKLVEKMPNVVWVFSSREKLLWSEDAESDWEESLHNIEVKAFNEAWMSRYFTDNEMEVDSFRQDLFELTKGIPLYLSICCELYQKLWQKRMKMTIKSFEGKQERLIQTYAENLTRAEQSTLFVLSCLGEWTDELISYLKERVKIDSFPEAYHILMRKSYISEIEGGYELHQVIQEQVFAFCKEDIIVDMAKLLWDYLPEDRFSWDYPKFLRCRLRCIKNDEEAEHWWISEEAEPLKRLIQLNNINGYEACYKEILKQTERKLEDSVINVVCAAFHIRNLLWQGCPRQAQQEANHMLRIRRNSGKQENQLFRGVMDEILELKAQALDAQKKYETAFRIREELCNETELIREEDRISRIHNLAGSYQNLGNYRKALELTEKIIKYRRLHMKEEPENFIRALALKGIILKEYFKNNYERKELIPLILEAFEEAFSEAERLLEINNTIVIDMEIYYADIMSDFSIWEEALKFYTSARDKLFKINQGRNRLTDDLNYRIAIALSETGNTAKALEILEELQNISGEYQEGSEYFSFRCMLERGNGLSLSGRHEEAKKLLLGARDCAREQYGIEENIVLKLSYAAAVEDYFLERYEECLQELEEICPQVIKQNGENSAFVYMLKKQRLRCLEKMGK